MNLLENHGFRLISFLGRGTSGDVYQAICNERAIRLVKVDPLEADPYDESKILIENQIYETRSIEGKKVAVKVIEMISNPDPSVASIAWDNFNRAAAPQSSLPGIQSVFPQWNAELHLENLKINFPDEATILLGLNHINVVKVYDVVIDYGNYTVYIVMELMETSLVDYVSDRDPLPLRDCNDYISQLLNGLDYLHSNNILHNDIHSNNIMVNQTDKGVIVKYVDFGLAINDRGGGNQNIAMHLNPTSELSNLGRVLVWLVNSSDFGDYFNYEERLLNLFNQMIARQHNDVHQVKALFHNLLANFEARDLSASMRNLFADDYHSDDSDTQHSDSGHSLQNPFRGMF